VLRRRDPLHDPAPLIPRVYAYVAYRIGAGADADEATGEVFARAVRYRATYDPARGEPISWLLGIARRVLAEKGQEPSTAPLDESWDASEGGFADRIVERLDLWAAVASLSERDRELIALRYGADLSAPQIAGLVDSETHAMEVALSRAVGRLRATLAAEQTEV
jgi:RNA polymerase sigma-70 factor (ECF subfamily)